MKRLKLIPKHPDRDKWLVRADARDDVRAAAEKNWGLSQRAAPCIVRESQDACLVYHWPEYLSGNPRMRLFFISASGSPKPGLSIAL